MKPADMLPALRPKGDLLPFLAGRPRHELEFLPAALEIIDTPAPPAARLIPAVICAFVATVIGWSIVGRIDIVANATGTVIPAGKVKIVQPLVAGSVEQVLVSDGEHVVAGQPLVRLDSVAASAVRDRIGADLAAERLEVAGLAALTDALARPGRSVGFRAPQSASPTAAAAEYATVLSRYETERAKEDDLARQVAEKRVELIENESAVDKLRTELPLLASTRDMYRTLGHEGLASRVDLLGSEQRYSDAAHDLATQVAHAGEAATQATALGSRIEAARADYAHGVLQDLSAARQKQAEDEAQYRGASHEVAELVLRAPATGIVQQVAIHSVHGVVTPAQTLMVVVPDGERLVVEAIVANRDIGFVRAGQPVRVKVAAFPFTRYGLIPGIVADVSRNAVDDAPQSARDQPSVTTSDVRGGTSDLDGGQGGGYVARVALDRDTVRADDRNATLQPGMSATVEILTGRRRVISYLLSPVMRYAEDAGRER